MPKILWLKLWGSILSKVLVIIIFVLLLTVSVFADTELFQQANDYYKQRDYSKAIELYKQIESSEIESAALYFNLGNAYFKNGDLGHAVLNYMKAKRIDPTDQDIQQNLEFAQRFSSVQMEGVELNPITAFLTSIVENYKLNFLAWVSSFFFILFIVAITLRFALVYNNTLTRMFVVFSLVFLVIAGGLTTFKYRSDYLTKRAVIIAEDSKVFTGASEQSDVELEAAPGLVVEILSESTDYYQVLFENKRRGWIQKELVAEI
ncbi:MAG: tetratricopeptide repeat protein [Calditrichaeota bacterium]|nr:MAG: tetratricopeptide repeat protein [Calditrichota bacterium]